MPEEKLSPNEWIKLLRILGYCWLGSLTGAFVGFFYYPLPAAEKGLGMHVINTLVLSVISVLATGISPLMALAAYREQTDAQRWMSLLCVTTALAMMTIGWRLLVTKEWYSRMNARLRYSLLILAGISSCTFLLSNMLLIVSSR